MEVAYWQVFVFGTVAIATGLFGARAGLVVAIGWTIFTLLMVFTSSLAILQLGTAWISYGLFRERGIKKDLISRQDDKISKLESALAEALSDYDRDTRSKATRAVQHSRYEIIRDKRHRNELLRAIKEAKYSLLIVSGWIRIYVIDMEFLRELTGALKRGVDVLIDYGWQRSDGTHDSDTSITKAREKLNKLSTTAKKKRGWGSLTIRKYPTHEKVLIKDDDYVICGSNNWLSNRKFKNREQSIKIWDAELVEQIGSRYWSSINTGVPSRVPEQ